MPADVHDGVPDVAWDSRLRGKNGHFLQSRAWARFQERLDNPVVHAEGEGWMWLGLLEEIAGFRFLYVPYGPTGPNLHDALVTAIEVAQKRGCDFIRCEPLQGTAEAMRAEGARQVRSHQPQHTWVLDLAPEETALRKGLTKGHKGSINAAPRHGIEITRSTSPEDIDDLIRLLHATERRTEFHAHPDTYYWTLAHELLPTGEVVLYFASVAGRRVAGALGYDFGGTRYYGYSGADEESRRLGAAAPLVWTMIMDARMTGMTTFDFWGVAPVGVPHHPWAGISQFKRSFGGAPLDRLGTWEIPLRHWRYRLFRLLQVLRP